MKTTPAWLYQRREDRLSRTRRWGSRRPLRVVFTIMDEPGPDPWIPPCYMLGLGKLGVQFGPDEGLLEGHAGMPKGSCGRVFFLPNGRGVGLSWDGSGGA